MELFNNSIVLGKEEQFLLYQPYCGLAILGAVVRLNQIKLIIKSTV
jgi:hypothetical protein